MKSTYFILEDKKLATVHLMDCTQPNVMPSGWLITEVQVSRNGRGEGMARRVMAQVLADADSEYQTLFLVVEPDGTGLDATDLMDWYERLGFEWDDEHDFMIRPAK